MTERAELIRIHGEGLCHICGKPKIEEGSDICSYPHAMLPLAPSDPNNPDGFWTWGRALGGEHKR